jgi:CRP/FNR family transcriptional regulator, cyclic AMP receptor protein
MSPIQTPSNSGVLDDIRAGWRPNLLPGGIFSDLTDLEWTKLLTHAAVARHSAKATIYQKGASARALFVIMRGQVKISASARDSRHVVLQLLGEGDVFGEAALLDGRQRIVDATAAADCELLVLDKHDVLPLLRDNPDMALRVIALLCERLRRTTELVEDMIFLGRPARLAKKLLQLAESGCRSATRGIRIKVSQRELGNMLGLSRESINKQLAAWQRAGSIELERAAITLIDAEPLRLCIATG